jgi:hypothetical protein
VSRRRSTIELNDPPRTSCPPAECKPSDSGLNVSYWIIAPILVTLACLAYSASMRGPLLFDDLTLPLASPLLIGEPLLRWISGVRPLLMLTYWINYDPAASTLSYHLTNVLLHALNAMLVFCLGQHLFARHIVESTRVLVATSFTTLLFLLHPLQTESVSYVAGRSELLSATFVLMAWLAYVRRIGRAITGRQASLILFLFILAGAAKEQSVATIPAILLLTDWVFGPRSLWAEVKRNWRLYAPMTAAAAIGASVVAAIVQGARSVGASTGVNSLEYFLTQCRAMLLYLRLFVLPIGQNADRDFPISRSLNEHGAAFALIVVLALLVLAFRVKMPLVRYGALLFFALLAPTSSFIPLADPFAERRMYLPILGLAIALTGALVRLPIPTPRLAWTSAARYRPSLLPDCAKSVHMVRRRAVLERRGGQVAGEGSRLLPPDQRIHDGGPM